MASVASRKPSVGAPGPSTPLTTRLLRDIAADPEATQNLLRVLNHDLPPSQLLTPRRLATTAIRALRDQPTQLAATTREIATAIRDEVHRFRHRPQRGSEDTPRSVLEPTERSHA